MHPSMMPSFFTLPMPFHPEELHKHVKELERVYSTSPNLDTNGKEALAKAIISATASFVEGCIDAVSEQTVAELGNPPNLRAAKPDGHAGLYDKTEYVKNQLAPLRMGWIVKTDAISQFVEGGVGTPEPGLRGLRNLIAHGNLVGQKHLRLDNISYFRNAACDYLEQVYASLGIAKPGWLARL